MAWNVGAEDVTVLVAGVALAVLASWVFLARPSRRLNRSFAFLLVCQSLMFLLLGINGRVDSLAGRLRPYALIAIPFAMAYVAYQILACYRASPVHRVRAAIVFGILVLVGGAFELAYLLNHELFVEPVPGTVGSFRSGPLDFFTELGFLTSALLGVLFAVALRNSRLGLARRSLWQAMTAFTLVPVYVGVWMLTVNLPAYLDGTFDTFSDAYPPLQSLLHLGSLAAVAGCFFLLRSGSGTDTEARRLGWLTATAAATALVTSLVVAFEPINHWYVPHFVVYGLWSLASTTLLAAPILRDHILDVDFHVEWTLRNGVMLSIIGAAVFAVMEIVANWLSQTFSLTAGGLAAGLLLFGIHPLQRMTDRMAQRTLPRGQLLKNMGQNERRKVYVEQAEIAWSDGSLTGKERIQLDRLQARLGLDEKEAAHLERRAIPST